MPRLLFLRNSDFHTANGACEVRKRALQALCLRTTGAREMRTPAGRRPGKQLEIKKPDEAPKMKFVLEFCAVLAYDIA